MIYILGKSTAYEYTEMDDMIIMASATIDKVLEYAYTKISINNLREYEILFIEDGGLRYGNIYLTVDAYDQFSAYPHNLFLEEDNEEEYKHICLELNAWCNALKMQKKEAEQERREREEKKERELYEKLKAKYGD